MANCVSDELFENTMINKRRYISELYIVLQDVCTTLEIECGDPFLLISDKHFIVVAKLVVAGIT